MRLLEDGREWKLPDLLYTDDLVLCSELEEGLRAMAGLFAYVCKRRGLKVNAGKSKVRVVNGEEGLEHEIHVDRIRFEPVSEFKYLGCVLDDQSQMGQNAVGR